MTVISHMAGKMRVRIGLLVELMRLCFQYVIRCEMLTNLLPQTGMYLTDLIYAAVLVRVCVDSYGWLMEQRC